METTCSHQVLKEGQTSSLKGPSNIDRYRAIHVVKGHFTIEMQRKGNYTSKLKGKLQFATKKEKDKSKLAVH